MINVYWCSKHYIWSDLLHSDRLLIQKAEAQWIRSTHFRHSRSSTTCPYFISCHGLNCMPPRLVDWSPNPPPSTLQTGTTPGDRAFQESSLGWALIHYNRHPYVFTKGGKWHRQVTTRKHRQTTATLQEKGRGFWRNHPCAHFDLGLPATRTVRKLIFAV